MKLFQKAYKYPFISENNRRYIKMEEPTSKFVKVRCPKCKNEQIIFGKSATEIKCLVCDKIIAEPTGGKTNIKARILEVLE
jgi:small subunit ribosomal protein S27e